MTRRVTIILALLVFGAVAQTVCAYALALRAWEVHDDPWPRELMMGGWPGPVPREWVTTSGMIVVHPQRRFSNATPAWDWQNFRGQGDGYFYELNVWRMGWPLRSIAAYRHGQMPEMGRIFREPLPWRWGWVHAWMKGHVQPPVRAGDPPRVWPLYPIWVGLVLNTLMLAAVPGVMLWSVASIRRWSRMRKGLCEYCGYCVVGLDRCPECGRSAPANESGTIRGMKP